jgi:hypothetical protein
MIIFIVIKLSSLVIASNSHGMDVMGGLIMLHY